MTLLANKTANGGVIGILPTNVERLCKLCKSTIYLSHLVNHIPRLFDSVKATHTLALQKVIQQGCHKC